MKLKKAETILSALASEPRITIFRLLMSEDDENGISAGNISEILQIPPTTLSFHLSQLSNAGLVSSQKEGRMIKYSAKKKLFKKLYKFICLKEKD